MPVHRVNYNRLELWGDNQFEVLWALTDIAKRAEKSGWQTKCNLIQGFIPEIHIAKDNIVLIITGFGGYRFWDHLPAILNNTLKDGKVDLVLYDKDKDKMIIAVEDSSATMTGNQSQQRAERVCAFAREKVTVAYLLPSHAVKAADGGVRTPNLWVPITALCLIAAYKVPALLFQFGTVNDPDNKFAGEGSNTLHQLIWESILKHFGLNNQLKNIIVAQIKNMLLMIDAKHDSLFYDLPHWNTIKIDSWAKTYSDLLFESESTNNFDLPFNWIKPISKISIPTDDRKNIVKIKLPFAQKVGGDIVKKRAYFPIKGQSVGRPDPPDRIKRNINSQKKEHKKGGALMPEPYEDNIELLLKEGLTEAGNISPSVIKKGLIRYEKFGDLKSSIESAYPRLNGKLDDGNDGVPAILFIASNTVPMFLRDPYAGMLASYAVSNGSLDPRQKTVVVLWTPWQTPMLTFNKVKGELKIRKIKTTKSWVNHASYTIFNAGIMVKNNNDDLEII